MQPTPSLSVSSFPFPAALKLLSTFIPSSKLSSASLLLYDVAARQRARLQRAGSHPSGHYEPPEARAPSQLPSRRKKPAGPPELL